MARKKRTSWLAISVSVSILIGMFAVAVFYVEKNTEIVIADESFGDMVMIPTVATDENGSVKMDLRYITTQKNVNVFDKIYESEKIAISDRNFTELYLLERTNTTENTHVYQMSKVENATFLQVLTMSSETFENLTTVQNVIVQDTNGAYSAQVRAEGKEVFLSMTKMAAENES